MNAEIKIQVWPRLMVPSESRVEWFEKYGIPVDNAEVSVSATLTTWRDVGYEIQRDGSVEIPTPYGPCAGRSARAALEAWIKSVFVETGELRDLTDADVQRIGVPAAEAYWAERDREQAAGAERDRIRSEEAAAERAARVAVFRAQGLEGLLSRGKNGEWRASYDGSYMPEHRDAIGQDCHARAEAEARARNEREATDRKAAVIDLVTRFGTDNQRERLAADVLPAGEVAELLLAAMLPADVGPAYQRIQHSEIEHHEECCEASYQSWAGEPESVDAPTWEAAQKTRARIHCNDGTVTVVLRVHRVRCSGHDDCGQVERHGLRVTVTWRGLSATREYAVEGDAP